MDIIKFTKFIKEKQKLIFKLQTISMCILKIK